jgi:hypothetical protein
VIDNKQLSELPSGDRNIYSFILLNSNVNQPPGGNGPAFRLESGGSFSISGTRPSTATFKVDGLSNTDPTFGTPTITPSLDSVQEFQVQNSAYSAEYEGIGQVNVATKAGTSRIHGSVFEFVRNDALQPHVDAVTRYHFNPQLGLINELVNHDLTRPQNEYSQLVYTGHCLENLWMLLDEAVRIRNERLFTLLSAWFKRHLEVAWDDVYGGVFRNLQNAEKNIWLVDKVLWAQEEVLIGTMMILERTGAEWAIEWFDRMYGYLMEKYPLQRHGSPLWMYASDRRASFEAFQKMPKRVENFHHPRHLMLNLLSLERMIKR